MPISIVASTFFLVATTIALSQRHSRAVYRSLIAAIAATAALTLAIAVGSRLQLMVAYLIDGPDKLTITGLKHSLLNIAPYSILEIHFSEILNEFIASIYIVILLQFGNRRWIRLLLAIAAFLLVMELADLLTDLIYYYQYPPLYSLFCNIIGAPIGGAIAFFVFEFIQFPPTRTKANRWHFQRLVRIAVLLPLALIAIYLVFLEQQPVLLKVEIPRLPVQTLKLVECDPHGLDQLCSSAILSANCQSKGPSYITTADKRPVLLLPCETKDASVGEKKSRAAIESLRFFLGHDESTISIDRPDRLLRTKLTYISEEPIDMSLVLMAFDKTAVPHNGMSAYATGTNCYLGLEKPQDTIISIGPGILPIVSYNFVGNRMLSYISTTRDILAPLLNDIAVGETPIAGLFEPKHMFKISKTESASVRVGPLSSISLDRVFASGDGDIGLLAKRVSCDSGRAKMFVGGGKVIEIGDWNSLTVSAERAPLAVSIRPDCSAFFGGYAGDIIIDGDRYPNTYWDGLGDPAKIAIFAMLVGSGGLYGFIEWWLRKRRSGRGTFFTVWLWVLGRNMKAPN